MFVWRLLHIVLIDLFGCVISSFRTSCDSSSEQIAISYIEPPPFKCSHTDEAKQDDDKQFVRRMCRHSIVRSTERVDVDKYSMISSILWGSSVGNNDKLGPAAVDAFTQLIHSDQNGVNLSRYVHIAQLWFPAAALPHRCRLRVVRNRLAGWLDEVHDLNKFQIYKHSSKHTSNPHKLTHPNNSGIWEHVRSQCAYVRHEHAHTKTMQA